MAYEFRKLTGMVDLSTFCNASCPQCHRTNQGNIQEKVPWLPLVQTDLNLFKKRFSLGQLKLYKELVYCGTWGDPFMAKEIYEICQYVLRFSDVYLTINTNGAMRNEDFWFNFGNLNNEFGPRINVTFAIDGYTEEQHAIYRRNTSLKTVLEHMDAYMECPQSKCTVFTVVFEHNENDVDKITQLAKEHGASEHHICPSNRFYNGPIDQAKGRQPDNFKFYNEGSLEILHKSKKIKRYYEVIFDE
tara:strand:- start:3692 stop:4426 length:735 start_codon:yes stop_codon:yes gene_type:complete